MTRLRKLLAAGRTTRWLLTLAGLVLFAAPGAVQAAPVTFLQYNQINPGYNDVTFTNTGTGGTFVTNAITGTPVNVTFSNLPSQPGYLNGQIAAHLFITATTSTQGGEIFGSTIQPIDSGTLQLIADSPLGPQGKNVLLSVVFQNEPIISGQTGASSANLDGSTDAGDTVVFASDFLSFTNTSSRALSLSLTSLISGNPNQGLSLNANNFLNSFTAASTGTFSSDPAPIVTVPEPATIALVGLGLLGVPFALRHRRASVAAE